MTDDEARTIVKATVPLLETGGEALTSHFYKIMLGEYPEVRPLFNQAHQANGDQPRALANSILMYARHIDRLDALGELPAQIINKHVSLQVQPEHYGIVGACLLRAIREVLGAEIATDEVIAAWAAAYQQLADILIAAEESVYAATAAAPGGWRGVRAFRVVRKTPESAEILCDKQTDREKKLRAVMVDADGVKHIATRTLGGKTFTISIAKAKA